MAEILERRSPPRLQRPDGLDQAPRVEGRRRSPCLHGESALFQRESRKTPRYGSKCMSTTFEPIFARSMPLDLFGRAHRIYVEEARQGTRRMSLHTAGSDGRQYPGL